MQKYHHQNLLKVPKVKVLVLQIRPFQKRCISYSWTVIIDEFMCAHHLNDAAVNVGLIFSTLYTAGQL